MNLPSSGFSQPAIHFHINDLPADLSLGVEIAIDGEMTGLHPVFNRLCLLQLRGRDTDIHLVQITRDQTDAPVLKQLLENPAITKILHYGRADLSFLQHNLNITAQNIFCTYVAAKLVRTYADRHGLKDVLREYFGIEINKTQQQSDWGVETLSDEQKTYAASDVLYLHALKDKLTSILKREGKLELAQACFAFLPTRAKLDGLGWFDMDIFAHGKGHYARD